MHSLQRLAVITTRVSMPIHGLTSAIPKTHFEFNHLLNSLSTKSTKNGDNEWNDVWETAWLPEDLTEKRRAPWEMDVNFPSTDSTMVLSPEADSETKAFVEEMDENWIERRKMTKSHQQAKEERKEAENGSTLYSLENMKKDYRLKKQRIHAGLWIKEIEKQQEAKLGDSPVFLNVRR